MPGIGHNQGPAIELLDPLVTDHRVQLPVPWQPRFDVEHKPNLAQLDVNAIVAVIERLEAELVPLRDQALGRHEAHKLATNAVGRSQSPSYVHQPIGGDWDERRFRELHSILADCRVEIRERRRLGFRHPHAWPSEHERQYARLITAGASNVASGS